jgi:N-acyl-D-amino-acid deacylase
VVNVAALVGHTSLRNNVMDRLDRAARPNEIVAMRFQLEESLEHGALGLSTGLAYSAANAAPTAEVMELAEVLHPAQATYATHIRTESDYVIDALNEAIVIGKHAQTPVVISHLKCNGIRNWKRSGELLRLLDAQQSSAVGWDAYTYAASSTILDQGQVDECIEILIAWSTAHPEMSGRTLAHVARQWDLSQKEAANRLQPAGAIYHSMSEDDVRAVASASANNDRLGRFAERQISASSAVGTFPRVLGLYGREQRLFSIAEAVRKMTSLPAQRFGLKDRESVREGNAADLVLFDAETVRDAESFTAPKQAAHVIEAVWVNGVLSYWKQTSTGGRAGGFSPRQR